MCILQRLINEKYFIILSCDTEFMPFRTLNFQKYSLIPAFRIVSSPVTFLRYLYVQFFLI